MQKLLILGATRSEITIIDRARELGLYTIVTDRNLDHRLSPAKDVADEYWNIDWSHIEELEERCRAENISGIIAGYSEIRVDNLVRLCERLGMPCYTTAEQLETIRSKDSFKSVCRDCGIPIVNQYAFSDDIRNFPVIVKPVDRAGSIGIGVANNKAELRVLYDQAMAASLNKRVIIEDYITDAQEVNFLYAIINGKVQLVGSFDTVIDEKIRKETGKVVSNAIFFPSKYEAQSRATIEQGVNNLVQNLKIKVGTLLMSGFLTKDGCFRIFEGAFRLGIGLGYQYCNIRNGYSYIDIYILSAIYGNKFSIGNIAVGNEAVRSVALGISLKEGVVGSVEGIDAIRAMPEVSDISFGIYEGMNTQPIISSMPICSAVLLAGIELTHENVGCLMQAVGKVYELLKIRDMDGNDMIMSRIEPRIVHEQWKN